MTKQPARVLLIEDDAVSRSVASAVLKSAGYHLRAEADALALDEVMEGFRPDLTILNVRFEAGPDGFAVARLLKRRAPDLPILFMTASEGLGDRLSAFAAGGDDYLPKRAMLEELVPRVRALLRRTGRLSSKVLQVADIVIDESARKVVRGGVPVELTPLEFDLLCFLAHRPGQIIPKTQLLQRFWDAEQGDANLVEVQISNLRRKLETHGGRIIHTERGLGYVLRA